MSEQLYEQYKDALRRGHVAVSRGRLDVAAAAYREASRVAPDRALPYVGLGGVFAKLGRTDDALAAYAAALQRAPADEPALRGYADVLALAGRRAEAADTLDRLATVIERDGRPADACDVAIRALELAESRGRRRHVEGLVAQLRAGPADAAAAAVLERAVGILEVVPRGSIAGPPPPDPAALTLAVETALESGEFEEARRRALEAAEAHRAVGQYHAAMDVCYQVLAIEPSDPDVHLALAELYLDRGWRGPAADKLVLLGRLAQLAGDTATRERLCRLAETRLPDDPRLTAVCA